MSTTNYNAAGQAGAKAATNTSTAGVDLFSTTDPTFLRKAQLTVFAKADLTGPITSVALYVYWSPDGTTWIPSPIINSTTGVATDLPTKITSASFSFGSNVYGAVIDVPMSGCVGLKITGVSSSGTPPVTLWVYTRDN